jgi:D-glycero-alpha-D-manno-heptose-7-phosphate kinase
MIIASCPTRISFGSADHEPFSREYGGIALNACINKRIYIILRKRTRLEKNKYRISYSTTELCNDIQEIQHPLVRGAMQMMEIDDPLEIIYTADVPARLGLATSSSMALALLKGLYFYKGIGVSNEKLAEDAYMLERVILGEVGGFQDQYCCFGGFNFLTGSAQAVDRRPVFMEPGKAKELSDHMLLVYSGNQENSTKVLPEQLKLLKQGVTVEDTKQIKEIVQQMYNILSNRNFKPKHLMEPMDKAWQLKKRLSSSMSGPSIQNIEKAIREISPSVALRLVGSGGGRGFLLVLAEHPELAEDIRRGLEPNYIVSAVNFDWEGAKAQNKSL